MLSSAPLRITFDNVKLKPILSILFLSRTTGKSSQISFDGFAVKFVSFLKIVVSSIYYALILKYCDAYNHTFGIDFKFLDDSLNL